MIRLLFRLLGQLVLAIGLVFAVADISRSLANDAVSLTTLGAAAAAVRLPLAPATGDTAIDLVALVSAWPAAVALILLGFLLMFIGRRPQPMPGRRPAR